MEIQQKQKKCAMLDGFQAVDKNNRLNLSPEMFKRNCQKTVVKNNK